MHNMKNKKQSRTGILTAALHIARAALPFLGRSAASSVISLGASSLLGKIFGGKIKKRRRKTVQRKRKKIYIDVM